MTTATARVGNAPPVLAAGTNRSFSHEVATAAPPSAVWAHWMHVDRWGTWDQGLRTARAPAALSLGTTGTIVDRSNRRSAFRVTEFTPGRSYAFETRLPGARLLVRRSIVRQAPETVFRHEFRFEGVLAPIFASWLGPAFRQMLPPTMSALARLAEGGRP